MYSLALLASAWLCIPFHFHHEIIQYYTHYMGAIVIVSKTTTAMATVTRATIATMTLPVHAHVYNSDKINLHFQETYSFRLDSTRAAKYVTEG